MSTPKNNIEKANRDRQQGADDKLARWHKTFSGQATPEQAARTLDDLKSICLSTECPAHAAGYETNRTFALINRQAVWKEIDLILTTTPTVTS